MADVEEKTPEEVQNNNDETKDIVEKVEEATAPEDQSTPQSTEQEQSESSSQNKSEPREKRTRRNDGPKIPVSQMGDLMAHIPLNDVEEFQLQLQELSRFKNSRPPKCEDRSASSYMKKSKDSLHATLQIANEMIRKHKNMTRRMEIYRKNEEIFDKLKREYDIATEEQMSLITHLEALVESLNHENKFLKSQFEKNGLAIPEAPKLAAKTQSQPQNAQKKNEKAEKDDKISSQNDQSANKKKGNNKNGGKQGKKAAADSEVKKE